MVGPPHRFANGQSDAPILFCVLSQTGGCGGGIGAYTPRLFRGTG